VAGTVGGQVLTFKDALDTPFRVHIDDARSVELTLVEVADFDYGPGWESFSLLFTGPEPAAFRHGLFTVEHAEMGSFPMFIVAVLTFADGLRYEAIFNRPAP
jgi:hypothetical protein